MASPAAAGVDAPFPALFHIGYSLPADLAAIRARFRTVKYVLLAGSNSRARALGEAYRALDAPAADGGDGGGGSDGSDGGDALPDADPPPLQNLCTTGRYYLCQPHPAVLTASHGIGKGSADILLHELTSMLRTAGADDYRYIRTGSCGGLGVDPGSVVISSAVVDGEGRSVMTSVVLGERREYPAAVCPALADELRVAAEEAYGAAAVRSGVTMACNSFYEEQGRLDGALCEYTEADQRRFLTRCRDELHVVNFEMESLTVASFCTRASIPCAVVCAVLVNRTAGDGDTPTAAAALLKEWEMRPVRVATAYVFKRLSERCKRGLA